jgi:ATP-binding cassette subfamily B protein
LKPFKKWLFLAMALAGVSQILQLIDPIIFGKIIDQYALNPEAMPESVLISGALKWQGLVAGIASLVWDILNSIGYIFLSLP